jgi:peptidyl-prolyl cis-trans isomerase A (cyclophilin A)
MKTRAALTWILVALAIVAVAIAPRMDPYKAPPTEAPAPPPSNLLDPSMLAEVEAPELFFVQFDTTDGPFVVEVHRSWAPRGADRLYGLVSAGFYDAQPFYRVIDGFVAQWGLHPDPAINAAWREAKLPDDPVVASNTRGRLTFATAGPNTRTVQLYLNLADNPQLDSMGFAPVGQVISGMEAVDALYEGYGEGEPSGKGPSQKRLTEEGEDYMREFPQLDRIVRARIVR